MIRVARDAQLAENKRVASDVAKRTFEKFADLA